MAFLIPYTGVRFYVDWILVFFAARLFSHALSFFKKEETKFWNSFEAVLFFLSSACTQRPSKAAALCIKTEWRVACPLFFERIRSYHMVYELQQLASGRRWSWRSLCRALEKIKRVPYTASLSVGTTNLLSRLQDRMCFHRRNNFSILLILI